MTDEDVYSLIAESGLQFIEIAPNGKGICVHMQSSGWDMDDNIYMDFTQDEAIEMANAIIKLIGEQTK